MDLERVFQNRGTFSSLSNCEGGLTSYTAALNDGRKLVVSFRDITNGPSSWESLPETTINFVPLAIEAQSVGGFNAKHLLRVVKDGGGETPHEVEALTKSQFDTLLDWLTGGLPIGGGGSGVTSVTAQSPLIVSGSPATPQISIPQADASTDGYLSHVDWQRFDSKQDAGNYITALTDDVVATGPPGSGPASAIIQPGAVTTAKIANEAVTFEKIQNVKGGHLLGRADVTDGTVQEIKVGAGLELSNGELIATGGGGGAGTVTSVSSTNAYLTVTNGITTPQLTLNVGTGANTVAAGDDPRIVNAVQKTGDTMTGLLELLQDGLKVGADQIVAIDGKVGIGTNSPSVLLDVAGVLRIAGDGNEDCATIGPGTIRYNSGALQFCMVRIGKRLA